MKVVGELCLKTGWKVMTGGTVSIENNSMAAEKGAVRITPV
jgi:hypothetical protein